MLHFNPGKKLVIPPSSDNHVFPPSTDNKSPSEQRLGNIAKDTKSMNTASEKIENFSPPPPPHSSPPPFPPPISSPSRFPKPILDFKIPPNPKSKLRLFVGFFKNYFHIGSSLFAFLLFLFRSIPSGLLLIKFRNSFQWSD
jgi:hypothetical protein